MIYHSPHTIAEACTLLARQGASVLAGGTDMIPQMQAGRRQPASLVDIKKIPETKEISEHNGSFTVGAAVSGMELSAHKPFCEMWPGVTEAFDLIGSTQIQGRATPGGNFCNASPAADSVPAFIAAGASCRIAGPEGERECAAAEIILSPGRTSLQTGEFIVSFTLPAREPNSGDAYLRMTPRTEMDIAITGAAVNLTLDSTGLCTSACVVLGAVAPAPLLASEAAELLVGTSLDSETLVRFRQAIMKLCRPIDDKRGTIEYRTQVAAVLASRSAEIACSRARGEHQ